MVQTTINPFSTWNFGENFLEAFRVVFWSLSGYSEPKLPKKLFKGRLLCSLLFQMQHILKFCHVQKLNLEVFQGFLIQWSRLFFDFTLLLLNKIGLTASEVIAGKSQTEALDIKAEVLDFPVMTELTRLIFFIIKQAFLALFLKIMQ